MQEVIYEERLKLGLVLKLVLIFTLGMLICLTAWSFYISEVVSAWILLIVLVFTAILLFVVIPRRYQIFDDRLKVLWITEDKYTL